MHVPTMILIGLVAVTLWSLVSHRLERWGVAGSVGLMLLGAVSVLWSVEVFADALDHDQTEPIVELILALLLFVDATEVRGGIFGRVGRPVSRLIFLALPLSIVLAVVAGVYLTDVSSVFVLLVMACVIMPTDFAPAAQVLRARHVPGRIRQILNVESGYNDGLVSPLFAMMLPIAVYAGTPAASSGSEAGLNGAADEFVKALVTAVPATLFAIGIGVALGAAAGWLVRLARRSGYAGAAGIRIVMLAVPIIAFSIATLPGINANGFVTAFVAGVAYRLARVGYRALREEQNLPHEELLLVEEVSTFTAQFVWFILGGVMVIAITQRPLDWRMVLFAVLALTVFRILPVYLAFLGDRSITPRDRLVIGLIGPRGTASIVFGLIAFNRMTNEKDAYAVLGLTLAVVVGSVLLHGLLAPFGLRRIYRAPEATSDVAPASGVAP